jgi:hypothetical protein
VTLVAGLFMTAAGAFQLGIGVTLLLAVAWRDALALALAGFLVANTAHAVNHAVDLDLGGHSNDPWGLAALSLLAAVALVVRLGQLGWVVGEVTPATSPVPVRFLRQKTVLVTTYRRDGRPVTTPVSLAVDGPRPTDRSGHPGHGQTLGGRRVPARRPPAGRQAPIAARRAGAVDPSPGSSQDRQDGPFPADTPRPWPGAVITHGHPDEPSRHIRGTAPMHTGKPLGVVRFQAAIR